MNLETRAQLHELAETGESYAAFRSTAVACGLTPGEAEDLWTAYESEARDEPVLDVRDAGAELRGGGTAWLTTTEPADLEDYR